MRQEADSGSVTGERSGASMWSRGKGMGRWLWAVMLAGLTAGAQERQTGRGTDLTSQEREARAGALMAEEVRGHVTILDSATVREYIERLGRQLVAALPGYDLRCTFEIIADDTAGFSNGTHEPLSLPGGYVFVPAGLFLAAENEAEFAGMLAHAIAHVAVRHGARLATPTQAADVRSVPLVFLGGWVGMGGAGGIAPLGYLKFARAFESEADRLAAEMMARAGYDPAALVRYIERLQIDRTGPSKAFSPLPSREIRIAELAETIQDLPARVYSSSDEFPRIQEEVRGLTEKPVRRAPSLRKSPLRPYRD